MSNQNEPKNMSSAADRSQDSDDFVHVMDIDDNPAPALKFKLTPRNDQIGKLAKQKGAVQICATTTATKLPEDDSTRAPVDIVVVLDVSGSMYGEKLALCKKTLELLLRELRGQDRFGLVSFADEAVLEIPTRKLTEANKQAALSKIKSIQTRGCTNLSGGIGMGAQEIRQVETPNAVRTIFVLTDGHANRGISDAPGILSLTKGCLSTEHEEVAPVTIHTFGYGTDHDHKLLQDISKTTDGGTYYFVDSDSNVASAFGDALGGVFSVVAQNVVLSISVPPGVKLAAVHHDKKFDQVGESCKINLGDFYAEENRDVIFEVTLSPSTSKKDNDDPVPHAFATISYLDTIKKELTNTETVTACISRPNSSVVSSPNFHVVLQWLRVRTTAGMAEADRLSQSGDLKQAREKITALLLELRNESAGAGVESDPLVIQLIADLNEVMSGLKDVTTYESYGSKTMQTKWQSHDLQRCSEATVASSNVYRSSMKGVWARKLKE
eukprot:CAMPEP_0185724048 /NCGR_PEP_ID=MMETSP1171-20130828/654_1 /TAXON_ID=374046 /ORGANISM="Helicotheca tamensis, Strain CCMP826" /LENGTH=495 /DNA_ID=CAMNT_0028391823 /DNA_START=51 /DNA_END=1538 /DNA_ORIENTATION=+